MKYIFVTLGMACFAVTDCTAQTPADDSTWMINAAGTNEFNYNMDGSKTRQQQIDYFNNDNSNQVNYYVRQSHKHDQWHWNRYKETKRKLNFYTTNDTHNMQIKGGILSLMALREPGSGYRKVFYDTLNDGNTTTNDSAVLFFPFTVTDIISDNQVVVPYYIEMRYRQPDGCGDGISTAFWSFNNTNCADCDWSEVDYFEHAGHSKIFTHNVLWRNSKDSSPLVGYNDINFYNNRQKNIRPKDNYWQTPDFSRNQPDSGWHVFGCEVTYKYVAFYIDGKQKMIMMFNGEMRNGQLPYISAPDEDFRLANKMSIEAGISTLPTYAEPGYEPFIEAPTDSTVFPYNMEIDYIRYYTPRYAISTDINASNYSLNLHDEKVYRNITIGGNGGSAILNAGHQTSLRAKGSIILNDGFEIKEGAVIYIMNTDNE